MLCSICIATYKRPALLEKLLVSLEGQKIPENIKLETIVVDNDPLKSAETIVKKFDLSGKLNVSYFMQPEKSISLTRNLSVEKASGTYILFIDDDEYADENWIKNLVDTIEAYNADGVFGNVKSYFDNDTPVWIRNAYVFNRPSRNTGLSPAQLNTGNCIVRNELIKSLKIPFSISHGLTGGEDSHLFNRLFFQGSKFISCREAITYEYVPPERANISWLRKRVFRTGNNYSRTKIELASNKVLVSSTELLKGFSQSVLAFMISIIFVFNRSLSINWKLKSISNIGKVFAVFGYYPKEYK